MNIHRLSLSQSQPAQTLKSRTNLTLQTDEATKYGEKYMAYEAQDQYGDTYILGLRDLETKLAGN